MPLYIYKPGQNNNTDLALQWSITNLLKFPPLEIQANYIEGGTADTYTFLHRPGFIYKKYKENVQIDQKLEHLLRFPLNQQRTTWQVVWPQYLVKNGITANYIGFIMPKLENHMHLKAVIQHVPNPPKQTLVESLWNAFKQVHQHNIAIGDVSINNVMVNDSHECILIDCDSFAVEIDGTVRKPLGQTPGHWYTHLNNMNTIQDFQVNDLFGLAAIIFVILCGQEFYTDNANNNLPDAGIERRIQDKLFPVYTNPLNCNADTVKRFQQVDKDIRHLFIRTFTQHEPASLEEWEAVIEKIT